MKKLLALILCTLTLTFTACNSTPTMEPITTEDGLIYQDLVLGDGAEAATGQTISVHYTGTFEDGSKFDSSKDRGMPFEFNLGAGQVIEGWDKGFVGMKVGGTRQLTIPSHLGYGEMGIPGAIPGGATLLFEVELLDVK